MKHLYKTLQTGAFVAATALWSQGAFALGTAAGTDIVNTAQATYNIGTGGPGTTTPSNPTTTTVNELIDVDVTWIDAAPVTVTSGDVNRVTKYTVTNIGNGNENFDLTSLSTLLGDDFDPVLSSPNNIYLDNPSGIVGQYDVTDTPVSQTGVLAPDDVVTIFILNDIPTGLNDADTGDTQLTATSVTGTGAPGSSLPNAGDGGTISAVFGNSGGDDADTGTYIISGVVVTLTKSAVVTDPFGGSEPVPGATIAYTIRVSVTGSGTAANLVIADPIPANTSYVLNSIRLDTTSGSGAAYVSQTDGGGDDASDYNNTNGNAVTVDLGNVTAAAVDTFITFNVTIN
ncbi:MAG: hypothetical protein KDI30_05780 [Pseudomonadales bacterium]|nr:hypothetical protein [Pseudomonadales bacterium]